MPMAATTGPDEQIAQSHRAAEPHDPQGHDPAAHGIVQAGLQGGVQRGDEGEVEGADDGHHEVGGHRFAQEGEGAQRQRRTR